MTQEKVQRLADLVARLAETLMTAAVCADEVRAILRAELDELQSTRRDSLRKGAVRGAPDSRPLVDASTLSVFWAGRTCLLRQKTLFRLAERLARRPNQYITAGQLLEDVWDGGVKAPETIRSAIRPGGSHHFDATVSLEGNALSSKKSLARQKRLFRFRFARPDRTPKVRPA